MANKFNLTPRAKEDLRQIWNYTLEEWSENQADRYIEALFNRFTWIAGKPLVGKHRSDIRDGYYCFPQGEHLVFYLISEDAIDIIGIPHKEMDILNYFD